MTNLVIAKFGGSAIGPDGILIPQIIKRINNLKKDSKVITVFSAPLTLHNGKKRSLTDVVLEQGKNAENEIKPLSDKSFKSAKVSGPSLRLDQTV